MAWYSHYRAPGNKARKTEADLPYCHQLTVKNIQNEHLDNNDSRNGPEHHRSADASEPIRQVFKGSDSKRNVRSRDCSEDVA
jgi:hypothetical protein